MSAAKMYLGDSVYAERSSWERGGVVLTTENGLPDDPSNRIYLEPAVLVALAGFARSDRRGLKEEADET